MTDAIAQLSEQVSYLSEENRQLREALYPPDDSEAYTFGLSKVQLALFQRLQRGFAARESLIGTMAAVTGGYAGDTTLSVQIGRLRKKLKPHGYNIETVWGIGYRLEKSRD